MTQLARSGRARGTIVGEIDRTIRHGIWYNVPRRDLRNIQAISTTPGEISVTSGANEYGDGASPAGGPPGNPYVDTVRTRLKPPAKVVRRAILERVRGRVQDLEGDRGGAGPRSLLPPDPARQRDGEGGRPRASASEVAQPPRPGIPGRGEEPGRVATNTRTSTPRAAGARFRPRGPDLAARSARKHAQDTRTHADRSRRCRRSTVPSRVPP
jgi:hypothetical protein